MTDFTPEALDGERAEDSAVAPPQPVVVPPGGTVGILGGGQLGRMLATAAAELGLSCHIYSPDRDSPAFAVSAAQTCAGYGDEAALAAFAAAVDVVTTEFENVPADTAGLLAERVPVFPNPRALAIAQDRLAEKTLFSELGVPVAPFAPVDSSRDLYSAIARAGRPSVLKTRRLGYDGKGQAIIRSGDDPHLAWRAVGEAPSILEGFVTFQREISVAVARGQDGEIRTYDVSENRHEHHILARATAPAAIDPGIEAEAKEIGRIVADALDYVGVLAVEFFLLPAGSQRRLLANELAPRVHNSFHWTQDACLVSQFEQHIRAVCGWPLGDPARHSDVEMINLVGAAADDWQRLAAEPGSRLHLYGKRETRPGRKMGHINRLLTR